VLVSGSGTTASTWVLFKQYIMNTLAPWAQTLANTHFELSIGNEEELHCDGATLTVATVITDLANLATEVKSMYTYGPVSYQSPITFYTNWASNGLGSLDRIGFNAYALGSGIAVHANHVLTSFPGKGYLSEWGTPNGFLDFPSEALWRDTLFSQVQALADVDIDSYYFCYRDGSFGMPANKWAIKQTDDNFRLAAPALFGIRSWFSGNPNSNVVRDATPDRSANATRASSPARTPF
jgi:hypothetical protein